MAVLLSNPRKLWTRPEVEAAESTGVFDGAHFELIDGELIDKMGKKWTHVIATAQTDRKLEALFGEEFVNQQAPIDVAPEDNPSNEPEPDVIVLRRRSKEFENNPEPNDLVMVVEVSDTTLRHDLTTKAALYARAGIPEYWVLDLNGRRLLVRREPRDGRYQVELEFDEMQTVAPLEKPGEMVAVASLLG